MKNLIAIKAALHVYSKIIMSASQLIALIVVARFMGPSPLGMIGYAAGIIGIFSIVANLGFSTTHRKKISEGKDLGECIGTYFVIRMVLMTFWVSAFIIWIYFLQYHNESKVFSKDQEYVMYIVALSQILNGHSGIMRHTFWSRLEAAKSVIPKIVSKLVTSAAKIIVAVSGFGVLMLASSQLIGYTLLILIYLYMFRTYPFKYPSRTYILDYIKFTIPLMLTIPFTLLATSSSSVIIGSFWDVEEVAFYTIPMTMSRILALTSGTVGLILLPLISEKSGIKDWKGVSHLVNKSERFILLYMLPLTVLVIFFSNKIVILLFGEAFSSSAEILQVLAAFSIVDLTTRPYSTQMISTGYVNLTLVAGVICSVTHLVLNLVFIPETFLGYQLLGLGALGAAIATLIGASLRYLIYRVFAYKTIGNSFKYNIIKYYIAAFLMFLLAYHLATFLNTDKLTIVFFIGIISSLFYIFVLYALKEIDHKDFKLFKNILNPSKFRKYIVSEFSNND